MFESFTKLFYTEGKRDEVTMLIAGKKNREIRKLISCSPDQELLDEYKKCKSGLEILYDYITVGIILRLKSD